MLYNKKERDYTMASTPEYTRKAVDNYRKKFDVIQLRLPKGTKEIIDNKVGKANAHNFVVDCVLKALETSQETQEEHASEPMEEVPQEQPKKPQTARREPTLEELQELQELINQKKAEQDRKSEEQQKRKEEQEQQEKEERKAELLEHLERIRNGEQIPEDEEKEKLRQESIISSALPY